MKDNKEMPGTAPIGKLLFKLAVPTVVARMINRLYNIVDRIYIGHIPRGGQSGADLYGGAVCGAIPQTPEEVRLFLWILFSRNLSFFGYFQVVLSIALSERRQETILRFENVSTNLSGRFLNLSQFVCCIL